MTRERAWQLARLFGVGSKYLNPKFLGRSHLPFALMASEISTSIGREAVRCMGQSAHFLVAMQKENRFFGCAISCEFGIHTQAFRIALSPQSELVSPAHRCITLYVLASKTRRSGEHVR
jgi:hypothetical protein